MKSPTTKERKELARPGRFELPTLCLEVVGFENLNALSSVACGRKSFWNLSSVGLHGRQEYWTSRITPSNSETCHGNTGITESLFQPQWSALERGPSLVFFRSRRIDGQIPKATKPPLRLLIVATYSQAVIVGIERVKIAMTLIPPQQWICDKCGKVIEKPEDGWLEWLEDHHGRGSFKIVHHAAASRYPVKKRSCYHYPHHPQGQGLYLGPFLGPDGLAQLSVWVYSPGVKDLKEWVEMFRRLHVPHYEETRRCWRAAQSDDYFEGLVEEDRYSQDVLQGIIQQYGSEE